MAVPGVEALDLSTLLAALPACELLPTDESRPSHDPHFIWLTWNL